MAAYQAKSRCAKKISNNQHSPLDQATFQAIDSTLWLAEEDNLALLADAVGLEITFDETESSVGDFNVDIYATETGTDRKTIIENQLEDTDHDYLGKLITYASGKSADIVIWVVKRAREEHRSAIEWLNNHTDENIALNFPGDARHEAFCEDAFKYLDEHDQQYDLIVLDPPAFAKHRAALRNALKGYTRLNVKGLQRIKKGGILFTFSCSQVVTKDQFRNAVFTAAAQAGRKVRILHQLHQPADHPVNIQHPGGQYLNGLSLCLE